MDAMNTHRIRTLSLSCALLLALAAAPASAQLAKDAAVKKSEAILKNLQDGKTADIVKEFDATMTGALPEAKLKEVWVGLGDQVGAFKSVDDRREGMIQGIQAVELILSFEKAKLVMRTAFDKEGKVSGLFFQPVDKAVLPAGK